MLDTSSPLAQLIRRSLADPAARECADRDLLRRFLDDRDTAAFEAILSRHGPMVLDVCRSLLTHEADIEDAFQATFLVLARAAATIRKAASLAAWLHGVARHTAVKVGRGTARCGIAPSVPERGVADPDELSWREVRQVLHEELDGLSDAVRGPLVHCYLEGMTHDRAATCLGLSKGTLRRRLEQGRALLRDRLTRRGLGAALVVAVAYPAATAAVRRELVTATINAACGTGRTVPHGLTVLVDGVLKTMYLTKLKVVGVALLVCAALALASVAGSAALGRGEAPESGGQLPVPLAGGPEGRAPVPPWEALATLRGHKDEIVCLAFGSHRLATADRGGAVKVWDSVTGKESRSLTYPVEGGPMEAMAFTARGAHLVVAFGDRLAVWSTSEERATGPKEETPTALPQPAALAVDGLWVLRRDARKRWAWEKRSDLPSPSAEVLLSEPEFATGVLLRRAAGAVTALSPSGETLAIESTSGAISVWDVRGRKEVATCRGHTNDVLAVEFAPDGKTVASAGKGGTVRLWDAGTGKELAVLKGHDGPVRSVAFSPDGKTLVSGGDDKTVAVWDVKAARRSAVLQGHTGAVLAVAFRRDGQLIASAGRDKTVRLWEPSRAERLASINDREMSHLQRTAPQKPEIETRIEAYERAFRVQAALGNSIPLKMLATLDKVTIEKVRGGESRSSSVTQTTRAADPPVVQPLKFENLAVLESARVMENGRAIRFSDLEPPTVVRIELETRSGTFVVVGIEKVGTEK